MPVLDPNLITPGQHERGVSHEPRRLWLVVVTGALLVALGLAWFGGSNSYRFLSRRDELAHNAAAPALPVNAPAPTVAAAPLSGDLAAVKQAIDLMREGKPGEATGIKKSIDDPAARKVVEWLILRHPSGDAGFSRYAAFIADNPSWPGIGLLHRRAEGRLWQERSEATTVRRFTGGQPASAKGRFALARVLLTEGDRDGAERQVRQAWRSEELSEHVEAEALAAFRELLTREDHRARMDRRIGAKDFSGAMRAARRLGKVEVSIAEACKAVAENASKSLAPLDAVPTGARQDLGYTLCRIQWLMRHDRFADATRLMQAASPETMALQDTDEWWRNRRILARELLDLGEPKTAYEIVRSAASPDNPNYRAEFHFMAGWIALRFLADPATALVHFAHVDDGSANPIVLARAAYWRGRAHEAVGRTEDMRAHFEAAARHSTAYYGQLARARLGLSELELQTPPEHLSAASVELWLRSVKCGQRFVPSATERRIASCCIGLPVKQIALNVTAVVLTLRGLVTFSRC
jgi:soluble lytic murein transglycosylase